MKKIIIEILVTTFLSILQRRIKKREQQLAGTNVSVTSGMEEAVICFLENMSDEEKEELVENISKKLSLPKRERSPKKGKAEK